MSFFSLFKIALLALKRNKFRAFLTMLGVIIGVASVIAMLAIGQGSKESIQQQISNMGSNMLFVRPGSINSRGVRLSASEAQSLTLADSRAILRDCPAVAMVSPQVQGSGQAIAGARNWPTSIHGVNPDYLEIRKISIVHGSSFSAKDVNSSAKVCLLGQTVVNNLFGPDAEPVGQLIRFNRIPFKVIGVLSEKGESTFGRDQDDIILAPYTTVMKRILAISHLQRIYISAQSEDLVEQAAVEVSATLRREHKLPEDRDDDFNIRTQQELVTTFSATSEILTVLLASIAAISLLVGGIGIMNIMYVSVTERTREIGLRMAVGGKGRHILLQFLMESILLSVSGGLLGIGLGIGCSRLVASFLAWPISITSESIALAFAFCSAIGIFFGWYPAQKAASLDPIDALRFE